MGEAKPVFKRLFGVYGFPDQILTDNGALFAARSLGRLSRLSASWVQLGIDPIRASHNRTAATSGSTGRSRIEQQDLLRDEMAAMKVQFEAFKTQFE